MRTLYLKIFIWFWIATALVTLAHLASTILTGPDPRERFISSRLKIIGSNFADKIEREGQPSAALYLDTAEKLMNTHLYIFDSQNHQMVGSDAPDDVVSVASNPGSYRQPFFHLPGPPEFIVENAASQTGQSYTLVAKLRRAPSLRFFFEPTPQAREVIAWLAIALLLCYWLAHYLSTPVVKLRAATKQLAGGDLNARVGTAFGKRRDELADLGRDFDIMAERIQSLMLSQRRLLNDISHELRSPLARLGVALELARQGDPVETRWALDRIEQESERLNAMVGHVLTLARLENEGGERERIRVNLTDLVNDVATDADFEAQGSNRSVRVTESDSITTSGSPELLRSAIENVVRNALLYTSEGSEVEISLRRVVTDGIPQAKVIVRDHGAGVPEVALTNIFRPFYRVGDARDRGTGGTGLGLSITQRAVHLHGGTVQARNAIDGGLIVEILLPLGREPDLAG
jgi:two-component system, OmpR family, sensor histidine kinase CpxA